MGSVLRILTSADEGGQQWGRQGMINSHDAYPEATRPVEVWCDTSALHVCLADGRRVSTPLWWYPRLLNATPAQRNNARLMSAGIHWPDVDEDLSVNAMLAGWKAPGAEVPAGGTSEV